MSTDIVSEPTELEAQALQRAKEKRWHRDAVRTCRVMKEYARKLHNIAARLRELHAQPVAIDRMILVAGTTVAIVCGIGAGGAVAVMDVKDVKSHGVVVIFCSVVVGCGVFGISKVASLSWNSILWRLNSTEMAALIRRRAVIASSVEVMTRTASGLIEHSGLHPLVKTELLLRLRETENALDEANASVDVRHKLGVREPSRLEVVPFPKSIYRPDAADDPLTPLPRPGLSP